ncbi:hypothetical protein NC652_019271 [Populus alba x Populus x berolinensis]|nr:hypothetical protein NC652_019271 [Populus alba x Populus x berolinensis]KAJ6990761.1 hypothetical protein NC653_019115 [Populus alba x Populus x berolinensis]
MAKTTMSKQSKNSTRNISLKVPQPATKTKIIEPDVNCNTTGSSYMQVGNMAKTTWGRKSKNSTKNIPGKVPQLETKVKREPEISRNGTWSPFMDGIVGMPKSVAEVARTDDMINSVLYGLRNSPPLPIFKGLCPADK